MNFRSLVVAFLLLIPACATSRAISAETRRCDLAMNAAAEISEAALAAEQQRCHDNLDRISEGL